MVWGRGCSTKEAPINKEKTGPHHQHRPHCQHDTGSALQTSVSWRLGTPKDCLLEVKSLSKPAGLHPSEAQQDLVSIMSCHTCIQVSATCPTRANRTILGVHLSPSGPLASWQNYLTLRQVLHEASPRSRLLMY